MKNVYIIICFIVIILFHSNCKNSNNNAILGLRHKNSSIELFSPIATIKDSISFFAESIDFILLDSPSRCPVSDNIMSVISSNDYFFLIEFRAVYQFDKSGQFIRKIGRNGRGPGEYIQINGAQVDCESKSVIVFPGKTGNKIIHYDFDGKLLKEVKFEGSQLSFSGFDLYDNSYYFHTSCFDRFAENYQMIYVVDSMGKNTHNFGSHIYKSLVDNTKKVVCYGSPRNWSWRFNQKLYFLEECNDTIFSVKNDSLNFEWKLLGNRKLSPGIFHYNWPEDIGGDYITLQTKDLGKDNSCVFETRSFIFFRCSSKGRLFFSVYDKINDVLYRTNGNCFNGTDYQSDFLYDDILTGLNIGIDFQANDNQLLSLLYPYELLKNQEIIQNFGGKGFSNTEKFKELCRNLTENDNPVLLIINMKSPS